MGNSKGPLSLDQISSLATEKGLIAVGGVEPSCRYHLNYLSKLGCVEIISPAPKVENVARTEMSPQIEKMARQCYGYGRWDAPYWFIGLGEGMGSESLYKRAEAWGELQNEGLCDCRAFHERIRENRWHEKPVQFQPTWRRLMLLLMTFLERDGDDDSLLRKYQSGEWGIREGETCACELFGLPAPNFKTYKTLMNGRFNPEESKDILQKRIEFIRCKISCHNPIFVVMYGRGARKQWRAIADCSLPDDTICKLGSTMMVSAIHPTAHGVEDAYWVNLGERLRLQHQSTR